MNPYESDRYLAEYLLFHFGKPEEILPWSFGPVSALGFPRRTAEAVIRHRGAGQAGGRALDLGCAVGASTIALARHFDHVIGLDFSRRFIEAARRLAKGEKLPYERADEGGLRTPLVAEADLPLPGGTAEFFQGDAMDLPDEWADFDAVHAANLLCRLPEPMRLVDRFPRLVRPGGLLVLATPCTWMEEFTPKTAWLGGFQENGHPVRTIERLRALLSADFGELETTDEPFLIREHARKFQWSVAQLSVWKRRHS